MGASDAFATVRAAIRDHIRSHLATWRLHGHKRLACRGAEPLRPQFEMVDHSFHGAVEPYLGGGTILRSSTFMGPSGIFSIACLRISRLWRISAIRQR